MPSSLKTFSVAALAAGLATGLAACGGDSSSSPSSSTTSSAASSQSVAAGGASASHDASASSPSASSPSASSTEASDALPTAKEAADKSMARIKTYSSLAAEAVPSGPGSFPFKNVRVAGPMSGTDSKVRVDSGEQGVIEVINANGSSYVKGDKLFWTKNVGSGEAASTLNNKWVKADPARVSMRQMKQMTMSSVVAPMDRDLKKFSGGTIEKATLNGKDTYHLVSTDKTRQYWVSADGKFDPIKFIDDRSTVTFSQANAVPAITVPKVDIDMAKLPSSARSNAAS